MLRFAAVFLLALVGCKKASPPPSAAAPVVVRCAASGCPADTGTPRPGGELRVHVEAEPAVLCDLIEHDAWSKWILENQIQETLFQQDPWTGALTGRLAETFEATADALTLHLRGGVKWHDGAPFSSADVAFTLEKARDP